MENNSRPTLSSVQAKLISSGLTQDQFEQIGQKEPDEILNQWAKKGKLDEDEKKLLMEERDKKARLFRPAPSLKYGKELTPNEFPHVQTPMKLVDETSGAIGFSHLDASQWMWVIFQANILRGRFLSNPNKLSNDYALLPTNKNLMHAFSFEGVAAQYHSLVTYGREMTETLALTSLEGGAQLSTPWASGSASFERSHVLGTINENTTLSAIVKYCLPIGTLHIEKDPHALFRLNYETEFAQLLRDFERKPKTLFDTLGPEVDSFFEKHGEVIPLRVEFGLGSYIVKQFKATKGQTLDEYTTSLAGELGGPVGMPGPKGKATIAKSVKTEKITVDLSQGWHTIGGIALKDPTDVDELIKGRKNPNSWRPTSLSNCVSIIELLPKKLRDQVESYDDNVDFMSVFHRLEDKQLFYLSSHPTSGDGIQVSSAADSENTFFESDGKLWVSSRSKLPKCLEFTFTLKGMGVEQYVYDHKSEKPNLDEYNIEVPSLDASRSTRLHTTRGGPISVIGKDAPNHMYEDYFYVFPYKPWLRGVRKYAIRSVLTGEYLCLNSKPQVTTSNELVWSATGSEWFPLEDFLPRKPRTRFQRLLSCLFPWQRRKEAKNEQSL